MRNPTDDPRDRPDAADVIERHIRIEGRPRPGDADYQEYRKLVDDTRPALVREGLVAVQRRRVVDELWRKGYRRP